MDRKHNSSFEWNYCNLCEPHRKFYHIEQYRKHMKEIHCIDLKQDEKQYKCEACHTTFKNSLALSTHNRACNPSNPRLGKPHCKHCGKVYSAWWTVKEHIRTVHEGQVLQCEQCGKSMKSKKELRIHLDRHINPNPYVCDLCNKAFKNKETVKDHLLQYHLGLGNCICEICSKTFLSKRNLNNHVATVHSNVRPFSCDQCPKSFKTASGLQTHQFAMHVPSNLKPQFRCDLCDYVTARKSYLKKHEMNHLPDSEKQFPCSYCGKGEGI